MRATLEQIPGAAAVALRVHPGDAPIVENLVARGTPAGDGMPRRIEVRGDPAVELGGCIVEAASGRMPAFVDTGLNLVHVDDVARGHLLAEEQGRVGERYILGGENLSLAEILRRVAAITGGRPPKVRLPLPLIWPVACVAEAWGRVTGREPMVTFDSCQSSQAMAAIMDAAIAQTTSRCVSA